MCIFCRIAAGELPASIVYEDEHTLAFLDIQPVTPGHVLVVPKHHVASFADLPQDDAAHLIHVTQIVDRALKQSDLPCEGVNLFLADGKAAGQDVAHVHMHVFPRFPGDGFTLGNIQDWRQQANREVLNENAAKIREALARMV